MFFFIYFRLIKFIFTCIVLLVVTDVRTSSCFLNNCYFHIIDSSVGLWFNNSDDEQKRFSDSAADL